jgi:hypothetical protein
MSIRLSFFVVVPLALALSACPTKSDPLSCLDACSHQDELTFCDVDGVYPASELANECIAPPSADACNRVEPCLGVDKTICTDDSMGVCVECETGTACNTGEICNADSECITFTCTQDNSGNAACAAVDASQPYCGAGDICVGCLVSTNCLAADPSMEICDQTDFQCRGCVANAECPSRLCGINSGLCASKDDLLYVADGGTGVACTQMDPCGSITAALAVTKVTPAMDTIIVGAGDYPGTTLLEDIDATIVGDGVVNIATATLGAGIDGVLVSGDSMVSFVNINIAPDGGAANSTAVTCDAGAGAPSLTFTEGSISGSGGIGLSATGCALELVGATISGNDDIGVSSSTGALTITGSTISGNDGIGVSSSTGALTITGSTISGNIGGGIDISNSDFALTNNFIVTNGSGGAAVGGVRITNAIAATQLLDFNTIAGNTANVGAADATNLDCGVATSFLASGNIIYGGVSTGDALPDLDPGVNCSFEFSDISGGPTDNGNIDMDPLFVNVGIGDYHLMPTSPCIDKANPATTVTTDIDGQARPQGATSLPDMGADEAQ